MSFKKIVQDEQSLLEWIIEHSDENGLKDFLPDEDSVGIVMPNLQNLSFADGVLDGLLGSASKDKNEAKDLFDIVLEFAKADIDDLNDELADEYLGKIYTYTIQHRTLGYIDEFLELFIKNLKDNKRLEQSCYFIARRFLAKAVHREAVKFALALYGLYKLDNDDLRIYCTFGLADEFGIFVATALKRLDREDLIFYLAKLTKGWGRIAYVERLEVYSEEVRKWLLFEGYKCDIGIDHIVLECLEKGNLLGYIKENGWSEELYKASSDMINAFCGISKVSFSDYKNSKELVTLFVKESKKQKMNLESFSKLCDLIPYIRDTDKEEGEEKTFSDEEREELLGIIRYIAFEKGIDWDFFVRINPFNHYARNVAKTLGFDIWEDMYESAKNDKHFSEWYALSLTNDKERYKRLCALAKERFDLDSLKKEPKDELGLGREFNEYSNLEIIVQNLDSFDEIIGLELVETLLQSPVTRSRNMALKAIESYKEIPQSIIDIIKKNKDIEPNKGVLERYEKILSAYEKQSNKRLELSVSANVKEDTAIIDCYTFAGLRYEDLGLEQDLIDDFNDWHKTFKKHEDIWDNDNVTEMEKEFKRIFYERGLELAKRLKMHFKAKAYVEYEDMDYEQDTIEIKYYRIMSDYDCYLWTEEDVGLDLMCLEDKDELGIEFDKEIMEQLHKELESFCHLMFVWNLKNKENL